ncbi:MAG: PAS domain S-box protein [Bacteroidales bacterium]
MKRLPSLNFTIFSLFLVFNLGLYLKSGIASASPGEISGVTSEIQQSGSAGNYFFSGAEVVVSVFNNTSNLQQKAHTLLPEFKLMAESNLPVYYGNFMLFVVLLIVIQIIITFLWIRTLQKSKKTHINHEKLLKLVESSPAPTMVFQNYKIIYANPAFEILTGFHRKELLKMEVFQILHPDSLQTFNNDDLITDQNKDSFRNELQIVTRYKESKWVDFSARSLQIEGKTAVIVTAADITEKKLQNREIYESHDRLTSIISATGQGIFDYNLKDESLYLSLHWKEMLGYKETGIKNTKESWIGLIHPDDEAKVVRILENLETGNFPSFQTEYRMKCIDGSYKWILASFTIIPDTKGNAWRIIGTHTDVNERKEAEILLRENEIKFKNLFAKSKTVILISDADTGDILDVNDASVEYYGYDKDALLGKNMSDILAMTEEEIQKERKTAEDEDRSYYHFNHKLNDDTVKAVSVYESEVRLKGKNIIYSIVFDISQSKRIENELQKAKETAEEATRVKSFFISNLSHEIRTPLNNIIGLAQLIIDEDNLSPELLDNMKSIKFSSDHLLEVINEVLDFSKIEAGKIEFEETDFDVISLVKESSKTFDFKAREKAIDLNVNIDTAVPKVLKGDPARLRQILLNLLSNAVKFTSEGHVSIDVKVMNMQDDKVDIKFSVSDTGKGIPEDQLPGIFESYTQATKDTARKFGGTGLGLAICKKLTELLNGDIGVKSIEGMGSTFWVDLPLKISEKPNIAELGKPGGRLKNLKGVKILLVEDDTMNQYVITKLLKKWLAELGIAENGLQAIEMLKKENFNLVLMDLHMPELDGYETAERIRDKSTDVLNHNVPIIALTADVTSETRQRVLDAGMNDYITKPSDQETMFDKINRAVINQKTEFVEKQTDESQSQSTATENAENIKQHIKDALAAIFDDDLESTLALISRFLKDIPRAMIAVNEAYYEKDLTTLNRLVHKIKPAFSYLGFNEVSDLITKIQLLSRSQNNIDELEALCRELDDESRKIVRILRDIHKDYIRNNSVNIHSD